ncbi:UxaA family hydrolase [Niveispirillum cyanobacteriorum]|uniref:Altronate hydrolase n=1 Tax=Niveispirillum cyanobacteriorum TaxID=1612173 RepID=A0A2K9NHJ5_9PROT|nr:UxaA family hydrolase [Niveispirillum cyanobacteriorum]AUN32558.1 altronate hydrolase [Niveispirillum cyanobacteriorum]GGE77295.1 hydrolase [Niveispirillum cyanobacteriorum]
MAPAVILLHGDDNVVVCCRTVEAGEHIRVEGVDIIAEQRVALGHKLARRDLCTGDKVIKYGASIGSMTADIKAGGWVHMHNMKSDYIGAHMRDAVTG